MQEKALDILRKVHGENHPHVATALYNLGILLCLQEKYSDAIIQIKASLDRRKVVFSDSNHIIYDTMRILSYLYYLEGSFSQSRTSLEECLKIKKRNQSQFSMSDKSEITMLLNNLGLVLKGLLMYSDSEEILKESLNLRLELYSKPQHHQQQQHVSIATAYYTLGRLLLSMQRFTEAKDYLLKSQVIREVAYTRVHPFVANTYHSLSEVAQSLGDFKEAENLMNEVIEIRTQLYGESHLLVIGSLYRLQTLYKLTSNEIELQKLDEKFESFEMKPTEDDSSTALLMCLDGFEDTSAGAEGGGGGEMWLSNTSQFIKMDLLNKSKNLGIDETAAGAAQGGGVGGAAGGGDGRGELSTATGAGRTQQK
jgi:tetratricopeptide (TPR) repeat protein